MDLGREECLKSSLLARVLLQPCMKPVTKPQTVPPEQRGSVRTVPAKAPEDVLELLEPWRRVAGHDSCALAQHRRRGRVRPARKCP